MNSSIQRAHIYALIFDCSTRLQVLMDRELEKDGLTAKQWYLLLCIERSGQDFVTLTDLAALIGTSRQNTKQLALKLERSGFVDMSPNPGDGRSLILQTTDKCKAHFRNRESRDHYLLELLFAPVSDELTQLHSALSRLDEHFTHLQNEENI